MAAQKICIGVIGGNSANDENLALAVEIGQHIATRDAVLVCGGLGGVMEAVSKGAHEKGGAVIGILPGTDKNAANPHVTIALPTGMGITRNTLIAQSSDVLIALPGGYGTLSEIAFALALGKTVIHLPGTWDLRKIAPVDQKHFKEAFDARHAVGLALGAISISGE